MTLGIILRRSAYRVGGETRRYCRPCSTGFDRSRQVSHNDSIYTVRQFSTNPNSLVSDNYINPPNSDDSVVNVLQSLRNELKLLREDIDSLRKGNDRPIIKEKIEENINDSLLNGDQKATTKMSDFSEAMATHFNTEIVSRPAEGDDVESVHDSKIEESDCESDLECSEETVVPNGEEQQQNTEQEHPLLKKIESEIKISEEFSRLCSEDTKFPDDFPFKVETDIDGVGAISLSQLYQGERIDINIAAPSVFNCNDLAAPSVFNCNDRSTAHEKYQTIKRASFDMRLTVEVSCAISNRRKVAFDCSAHSYGFQIENVKNPGDGADSKGLNFSNLHTDLREELQKYLEIRGITPGATKILYGYMVDKANRERLIFYNKFKNMLEASSLARQRPYMDTGCTRP